MRKSTKTLCSILFTKDLFHFAIFICVFCCFILMFWIQYALAYLDLALLCFISWLFIMPDFEFVTHLSYIHMYTTATLQSIYPTLIVFTILLFLCSCHFLRIILCFILYLDISILEYFCKYVDNWNICRMKQRNMYSRWHLRCSLNFKSFKIKLINWITRSYMVWKGTRLDEEVQTLTSTGRHHAVLPVWMPRAEADRIHNTFIFKLVNLL
jgi:hypothetical protein